MSLMNNIKQKNNIKGTNSWGIRAFLYVCMNTNQKK